jgi:hypothetical protein
VGGFDGCIQRQDRRLKIDSIENPFDALTHSPEALPANSRSVHNVLRPPSSTHARSILRGRQLSHD